MPFPPHPSTYTTCTLTHTHKITTSGTIRALSQPASPHIASLHSERPQQQYYPPPARMSEPPRRWASVTRVVCIGERGRDMSEVCSTPTITERSTQASVGGETNNGWRAPNTYTPVYILAYPAHPLVPLTPHYIWSNGMLHDA